MSLQRQSQRDQRRIVVETGLEERAGGRLIEGRVVPRIRHARTRFVEPLPEVEPPKAPDVGDPWCSLTVRARLHRVNWVLRKDQRPGPRATPKSCMPEHVREIFKDQPGEPIRLRVPAADQDAINQTLADLVRFYSDDEAKVVIYAIIEKTSGEDLGETLGCSGTHARTLMKRMLDRLVIDWNRHSWRPDANDIERAKKLIHRNIK